MKKPLFIMLFIAVISTSIGCKSTSPVSTKLDHKTERKLKGNWTITSVNYVGSDLFKVTSFNIEDSKCFVGSKWSFVSNNNKGKMSINNPSTACNGFESPITWYLNKDGNFVLKITNGHKSKKVTSGFVLNLKNVTETSFDLVDKINVGGSLKDITYSFQKI